jgi:hypothetical protein
VNAVGTSEADCMSSLQMKVATATPSVIASCNNDAHPIRECFVVSQNTSYPGAVSPVSADSEYDEYKSDEATCRATAADNAESKAVADCQAKYGVTCAITSQGFVFDYHTKERRRYLIFGPKDLHQVCDAAASAAPIAPYTTQCSVEIVAKSHY